MPARRALLGIAAHYFGTYGALDRAVADAWVAAAAEPWRFLFVVFPGPDGLSHLLDPCHALVLDAYRRIDRALGEFVARARTAGELPALFVAAELPERFSLGDRELLGRSRRTAFPDAPRQLEIGRAHV